MNVTDTEFELEFVPLYQSKAVRIKVEVIYQSEQMEKYRLTGGEKIMVLQKKIEQQHSWRNWRVLDLNFEMKNINDPTIANLFYIYKLIDHKRFGKRLSTYFRKGAFQDYMR